jgi:hypothetical protein
MNLSQKMTWTLGVLGVCAMLSAAAVASDTNGATSGTSVAERGDSKPAQARHAQSARRFAAFVRKLGLTDAQRSLALQQAKSTQPIVEQARRDAAQILVDADAARSRGEKVDVRAELKSLRQATLTKLEPMAQQVIGSLTPEQHKIIEDASTTRGRTFDEARLVRRTAIALSRPMTAAILEARQTR